MAFSSKVDVYTFDVGEVEKLATPSINTRDLLITGVLVDGSVVAGTTVSFFTKAQGLGTDRNKWFQYKNQNTGSPIILNLYADSWLPLNPYYDLIGVTQSLKLVLSQPQTNIVKLEFIFIDKIR